MALGREVVDEFWESVTVAVCSALIHVLVPTLGNVPGPTVAATELAQVNQTTLTLLAALPALATLVATLHSINEAGFFFGIGGTLIEVEAGATLLQNPTGAFLLFLAGVFVTKFGTYVWRDGEEVFRNGRGSF
jgi:hypothetical protein